MAFGSGLVMAMAMPPMAQCQREAYGLCERRASRLMPHGRWLAVARWRPWHALSVAAGEHGWRNGSLSATWAWQDAPLARGLELTRWARRGGGWHVLGRAVGGRGNAAWMGGAGVG